MTRKQLYNKHIEKLKGASKNLYILLLQNTFNNLILVDVELLVESGIASMNSNINHYYNPILCDMDDVNIALNFPNVDFISEYSYHLKQCQQLKSLIN